MKTLLTAACIAPMSSPILRDAAVVFDNGIILDLGPASTMKAAHADAQVIDLGQSIILPGLINAHTHLEITRVKQLPPPASFVEWIMALHSQTTFRARYDMVKEIRDAVFNGVEQSLACGVTTMGDISLQNDLTRQALHETPIRAVSFGEVLGMAGRIRQLDLRIDNALDTTFVSDRLKLGIEPHAPYSLDLTGFRRCVEIAKQNNLPITTHLAETSFESEFLAQHSGPFRKLWDFMGDWDNTVSTHPGGVISAMQSVGLLDLPALLAHVNYASDAELAILAQSPATVVYCPRTHAYFGHPPHRFRDMLARGINVAIGTDSTASSPNLNLLEDVRLVHRLHPSLPAEDLFAMITTRAARALGMSTQIGALKAGHFADLSIFAAQGPHPLAQILQTTATPHQVWINGESVIPNE